MTCSWGRFDLFVGEGDTSLDVALETLDSLLDQFLLIVVRGGQDVGNLLGTAWLLKS